MSNKLPEIPEKYRDRVMGDNKPQVSLSTLNAVETDERPVAVFLSANDIAKMYKEGAGPYMFLQVLLERLRAAGCTAVEGSIRLKLNRGRVVKVKQEPGSWQFAYCWLPPSYVMSLEEDGVMVQ